MKLSINRLNFKYHDEAVLNNINFEVGEGEIIFILGPNGSGKTTLFKCILQLLKYKKGEILINGIDLSKLKKQELSKKIAYIPQNLEIFFNFSVNDIILMGRSMHLGRFSTPAKKDKDIVNSIMEKLKITHLRDKNFRNISGGERQIVLIARALVQEAKVLIMDEPTSALDYGNQIKIFDQIKLLAEEGKIIVISSHNPDHAFFYSVKILLLKYGKIIGYGKPAEILTEEKIKELYGVSLKLFSTYNDDLKVCVPNKD